MTDKTYCNQDCVYDFKRLLKMIIGRTLVLESFSYLKLK